MRERVIYREKTKAGNCKWKLSIECQTFFSLLRFLNLNSFNNFPFTSLLNYTPWICKIEQFQSPLSTGEVCKIVSSLITSNLLRSYIWKRELRAFMSVNFTVLNAISSSDIINFQWITNVKSINLQGNKNNICLMEIFLFCIIILLLLFDRNFQLLRKKTFAVTRENRFILQLMFLSVFITYFWWNYTWPNSINLYSGWILN